ncbi:MAG: aldo/keto reductase [Candidatus Latescibacteria bacterium]|nr:aldo/keto reductase [Candidatus Latescibacterota bacterium]
MEVSALGLGTVELGIPYGIGTPAPPGDSDCIRLLRRAFERGIRYFDTAAGYGRSEELLGRAFPSSTSRPVIATKAAICCPADGSLLTGKPLARHIEDSVQSSLRSLGVQELDLLQIHAPDSGDFISEDLLAIMVSFARRGVVRHWGVSTYGEEQPLQALNHPRTFRTLQVAYNLLDRRLSRTIFPSCYRLGVGLVLRSVFLKGALSARLDSLPGHLAPLHRAGLQARILADGLGISLPALALRFAAFQPQAHVVLVGTADLGELEADLAAFAAGPLPAEALARIEEIAIGDQALLNPGNWGI